MIVLRARESALVAPGAVAPTVAQTQVSHAPMPVAATDTVPLEAHPDPVEVPLPPAANARSALAATEPPPSVRQLPGRRANVAALAGVLLALVAVALLGSVLLAHISERRGKRNAPTTLPAPDIDAPASAPIPVAPASVVLPAVTAPDEPIAPLEPAVTTPSKGKRSAAGHK